MAVEHAELSEYSQCCRTAQDQSWDNVEQIQAYQYDLSSICNHDNLPFFFRTRFFASALFSIVVHSIRTRRPGIVTVSDTI